MKPASYYSHLRASIEKRSQDGGWYSIKSAVDDSSARIDLYDEIDPFWGVSASDFVAELRGLEVNEIQLHINSPGGSVYDGIAIMNALRQHDARVVTTIDGLAASAAGFIAVGASDELIMAENSEFMAHEAWGLTVGNAADMRKMADDLDRLSNNIASIYAKKAGGSVDDWRGVMEAETWYSADEAVSAGLADSVEKSGKPGKNAGDGDKSAKARFDLSIFNYAGRSAAPAPRPIKTPSAVRAEVTTREEGNMPTLYEGLRERLGLPEDADEAAVLAAANEQLDSVGSATDTGSADAPPEPTLQQIAASAKRLNLQLVDKDQYAQLADAANKGAQAFGQLEDDRRNAVLDKHVRRGALAKSSREHYAKLLQADPEGTAELLNGLPDGLMVPVTELGHAGEPDLDTNAELEGVFARVTGSTFGKD